MRIGILTFHRPINYGAFLQSYSLSNKIAKIMPNDKVEIIDYIAPKEKNKIYINILWTLKHYGITEMYREIVKVKRFKQSLQHMKLSDFKYCKSNLEAFYKRIDETYDIVVIGSDAVFNWNQNGYPSVFIPDYQFKNCKVMTYAASVHGLDFKEASSDIIRECGDCFDNMEFLGVRDKNTENFVEYCNANVTPIHCCDPTLFIDLENVNNIAGDYKTRIFNKYKIDLNKKYIIVMFPDNILADKIREKYGDKYTIITLFKPSKYVDNFLYDLTPFEWVMVLKEASLVITSYFHGTLLSLVQTTPTVVIDLSGYTNGIYESKLNDLMIRRFKLKELLFSELTVDNVSEEFWRVCDNSLEGIYNSRIAEAVKNERITSQTFMNMIKKFN